MTPTSHRGDGRRYVLDANALIAVLEGRPRSVSKVRHPIEEAIRREVPLAMSAVNWGEVFSIVWKRHGELKAREADSRVQELPLVIVGVDRERASRAGELKQKHGLAYADAFAAELAMEPEAWLVTSDPDFSRVGKALSVYPLAGNKGERQ